ncbi:class I adenylate cyclase [Bermanella sp. R86510]|uniref:class I adenylate cyclase n=1 Tax=unclassified Bermanella TaxID=2627862 RepID=UPI0037C9A3DE
MSDLLGGAGFDKNRVQQVVKRLLAYNQYRFERTQSALTERQKVFLDALPLFFHVNHEKLPGYEGPECPSGVARYQPSKDSLRAATTLAMGFQYQQRRTGNPSIRSLFIMGSCGSLGHSGGSDLDIWLCHDSRLDEESAELLTRKAKSIEKYAETLGLELHFFLMDPKRFVRGERNELGQEDCGSAQHQLLLDEFYRTSILLAGCYPIWWLVPPEYEPMYDDFVYRLYQQRFAQEDEVIDFGGLAEIPAGEFVGAGMWQLYKAIASPYKSILKLFLTEAYASGYPNVEPLSISLKAHIFDEAVKLEKLDPYLLLYDKLERYLLEREEPERLDLVRRCIYFKANIPMGQSTRRKHWKRDLLKPLLNQWGWPENQLEHLDNRSHWQVHTVMQERKLLVNELIHSYKFLSAFGREHQDSATMNAKDMTLLGHKLYATFDRKPGKIDFINPGISSNIQEDKLSLHLLRQHVRRRIPQMNWSLYTGIARPSTSDTPVKRSANLIELLAWCHVNKIMDRGTNVVMYQGNQHGKDYELKEILNSFQTMPLPDGINPNFERPPVPTYVALYVNVFVDPMSHYTRRGISKISNRTDSLGFSALKENLVLTIDQLIYNTWREVLATRYEGQNALLRVIEDYLNAYPPGSQEDPPELVVNCFCATRAKAIASRVQEVLEEVRQCFYGNKIAERRRYVLQIGEQYHLIQVRQGRPMIDHFDRAGTLMRMLAKPQPHYSQVVLDSQALKGTIVQMVCKHSKPGVLQVFYVQQIGEGHSLSAQIYILDERGSVIRWTTPMYNEAALINPIHHFLRQVEYRQNRHRYGDKNVRERPIEYYEVQLPTKDEPLRLRPIRPKEGLGQGRYFDVHAQVDYDAQNRLGFTLFCEQEEFSQLDHGDQVYKALVRHLVSLRRHHKPYPVYITDIAISDRLHSRQSKQVLQTATYLDYKYKLEARLNQALSELYPPSV